MVDIITLPSHFTLRINHLQALAKTRQTFTIVDVPGNLQDALGAGTRRISPPYILCHRTRLSEVANLHHQLQRTQIIVIANQDVFDVLTKKYAGLLNFAGCIGEAAELIPEQLAEGVMGYISTPSRTASQKPLVIVPLPTP